MAEPRSIVITGASRGLGQACAARFYASGWHVLAAMRSPGRDFERVCAAAGTAPGGPRMTSVTLDLDDPGSISAAASAVVAEVGAPDVVVHNAAFVAVGCVEELPVEVAAQMFTTNLLGPLRFTKDLLPSMRTAGRGRFVIVSSAGGVRGMPSISVYSATKGAVERWGESLAQEVAPFGLGVTIVSAGTFRTDVYDHDHTRSYADRKGPYAPHHAGLDRTGQRVIRSAKPPEQFAGRLEHALERALARGAPLSRCAIGGDAKLLQLASRVLPCGAFHRFVRMSTGLPRPRSLMVPGRPAPAPGDTDHTRR